MFLTLLLARLNLSRGFVWSPAIDLSDCRLLSTLIPGAQY
jgi:hypothetical protein